MDITSLIPIASDGPNRPLVESIGVLSSIPGDLEQNFHPSLGGKKRKKSLASTEHSNR